MEIKKLETDKMVSNFFRIYLCKESDFSFKALPVFRTNNLVGY